MKGVIFFVLLSVSNAATANEGFVHHPVPKEPRYLNASLYDSFKTTLPFPPVPGSPEQRADERELLKLQKTRTALQCEAARKEVFVSLKSFFEAEELLDAGIVEMMTPFFEQVRNDADFFIQKLKKDYPRKRPFAYISGIVPCVPKEVTGAYPSGHAVLSRLYALILSDFYPKKRIAFEVRAREIGLHRVLSGMHHPTDVATGSLLAERIYSELKKSGKFSDAFKRAHP